MQVETQDADFLSRLLRGYRVRGRTRTCAVSAVTFTADGRLLLNVTGSAKRQIAIDLPGEFNPHENEHLAWLLGWIERVVLE